jgi:hypothetical protein
MSNDAKLSLGEIYRICDQFHDSALLHFANHYGLFELTERPTSITEIAQKSGWVERKTRIMLDALAAKHFLIKDSQQRYRNAEAVQRYLVRSSPDYIGGVLENQRLQWELWSRIHEILAIEEVHPLQQEMRFARDHVANRAFQAMNAQMAQQALAPYLEAVLPRVSQLSPTLSRPLKLIDLMGGHGCFLAGALLRLPGAKGELWDRPEARPIAEETFARFGVADRCMFREVDVRDADIFKAGQAAVLMLNNALHYFTAEGVTALLANASQLLVPGGLLVVSIPFYLEETRTAPPESAGFSLHMMLNAQYGELHPIRWVENEMKRLGLTVVHESLAEETGDRFSLLIGTGQIT